MLFKRSSQLILHALFQRQFSRYSKATYNSLEGMPLSTRQIIERLEAFAPLSLAETWDNVGLLVDPLSEDNVETILLTNDLTERVVDEAVSIKAGLIVSYHPNIFRPLKRLTSNAWKERIVIQCIKNNIAVFSPHTTWDSVVGGVNDWLAGAFDISTVKPISPRSDNPNQGAGRILTLKCAITVEEVVNRVKQRIGIPHLRLALANGKFKDSTVSSVALCAGSGSSVLNGVQADLYLTGEMLHHDILDAAQNGIHVILCNHSDSERGFLRSFRETLQKNILEGAANVVVSQFDCDPLVTV